MDKHNLVLGLVELRGVYVTPCTLEHLQRMSSQHSCCIGQLLGILIDKAHVRQGADNFRWSGISQAKIDKEIADRKAALAAEKERKRKKLG